MYWEHILYIEIESLLPPLLTPPTDCLPQENHLGLWSAFCLRSAVLKVLSLAIFVTIVGIVYRMIGIMNCGDTV
jgi:hypothetical protein